MNKVINFDSVKNASGVAALFGLIVLSILFLVFFPLGVVFSLNTLFGLGISYSFKSWLSVVLLSMFGRGITNAAKG